MGTGRCRGSDSLSAIGGEGRGEVVSIGGRRGLESPLRNVGSGQSLIRPQCCHPADRKSRSDDSTTTQSEFSTSKTVEMRVGPLPVLFCLVENAQ